MSFQNPPELMNKVAQLMVMMLNKNIGAEPYEWRIFLKLAIIDAYKFLERLKEF